MLFLLTSNVICVPSSGTSRRFMTFTKVTFDIYVHCNQFPIKLLFSRVNNFNICNLSSFLKESFILFLTLSEFFFLHQSIQAKETLFLLDHLTMFFLPPFTRSLLFILEHRISNPYLPIVCKNSLIDWQAVQKIMCQDFLPPLMSLL